MVSYVKNDVDKEELYVVSAASHHPGVLLGYILGVEIAFNFSLNSIIYRITHNLFTVSEEPELKLKKVFKSVLHQINIICIKVIYK